MVSERGERRRRRILALLFFASGAAGLVDQVARFTQSGGSGDGAVGFGLHEFFFIGDFSRYGLVGWDPLPA